MSWGSGFIRKRAVPGAPRRHWPRLRRYTEYDPRYDTLVECVRCGRKVGEGPLKAIRLWRVRHTIEREFWNSYWSNRRPQIVKDGKVIPDPKPMPQGCPESATFAVAECADQRECEEYRASKARRQREQQERRRPKLPHADAPAGTCKWCGEEIEFDESVKGWKRRRQRAYHRGDEFEQGDRNCLLHAEVWLDPKRGTQELLRRQEGKCTECGEVIATQGTARHWVNDWDTVEIPWWHTQTSIDIDHVLPIVDGGENLLDNLQAICNDPCHKAKTAREAKARAKARKAGVAPEPKPNPGQLEMVA